MTLSPVDDRRVTGIDGPEYKLDTFCVAPGCPKTEIERHHMWRRSVVGGDKWWVRLRTGEIVANCVGLCNRHHREITDNYAKITYEDGEFCWTDPMNATRALVWQPPEPPAQLPTEVYDAPEDEEPKEAITPQNGEVPHEHDSKIEKETCPSCLRPLPRPKVENEEEKVRKTYSVAVPKDRWEDGAEVISTLVEEARKEMARRGLAYGDGKKQVYYIVTTALALFIQNAEQIMSQQ